MLLTDDNFKPQVSREAAAVNGALFKAAEREIEFSNLKHANIVQVSGFGINGIIVKNDQYHRRLQFYGYCSIEGNLCLAMEICQASLHNYIQTMKGKNVLR